MNVIVYKGDAVLDDGVRQEGIHVSISRPSAAGGSGNQQWGGRVLSNCDWAHWQGRIATLVLPDGANALVTIARTGVLTGVSPAPFGNPSGSGQQ